MRLRNIFFTFLCTCATLSGAQDTLLLFHPTTYNLELIEHLEQEKLLDLENYHVLGVYHSGEAYPYEQALLKVSESPNGKFSLLEVSGELDAGELFASNLCTDIFEQLFKLSRGALFMGGPDIPPQIYNEATHLLTMITDPYRHYMETSFIFHLLGGKQDENWIPWLDRKQDYLLSGICLGMQSMNVATGGTMIQDIPTEVYGIWTAEELLKMPADQRHRSYNNMVESDCGDYTSYHFHGIKLSKSSFLQKGLKFKSKSPPLVLSSHHQAIEDPGKGWKTAATSMDGKIIEAIEHELYPHVFGVQFHPEKPGLFDPGIIYPLSCDQQISFHEIIKDSDSYTFHNLYWDYLGKILQKTRK